MGQIPHEGSVIPKWDFKYAFVVSAQVQNDVWTSEVRLKTILDGVCLVTIKFCTDDYLTTLKLVRIDYEFEFVIIVSITKVSNGIVLGAHLAIFDKKVSGR